MLPKPLARELILFYHGGALVQKLRQGVLCLAVLIFFQRGLLNCGKHPAGKLAHWDAVAV